MKFCTKCKKDKKLDLFILDNRKSDGHGSWCKECFNLHKKSHRHLHKDSDNRRSKEYYKNNRDSILKRNRKFYLENPDKKRDEKLRRAYGISLKEWNDIFSAQGKMCKVCGAAESGGQRNSWHTDHDHRTGKIRAILCYRCNVALGLVQDNIGILLKLASYLEEYSGRTGFSQGINSVT